MLETKYKESLSRYNDLVKTISLADKQQRLSLLDKKMEHPDFWNNDKEAQQVIKEKKQLLLWVEPLKEINKQLSAVGEMIEDLIELNDDELINEFSETLTTVEEKINSLETTLMLSGDFDKESCFLTINAGAGGTESCDWAQMLFRMYERWASQRDFDVEVIDVQEGDVAGMKSATILIKGTYAFGYAKAEAGVHRLVRVSPFDSNKKRHTSFASVEVVPDINMDIEIEINPDDIKIDTYRASGAGGQHVNKTDSAVRITHLPTKIVVTCQSQRSQFQNKETCMKMLKSKLHVIEEERKKEELDALKGEKKSIGWGSQIRNYVFHPYTLVKDVRTGVEVGNINAVMDGNIDGFIIAYLKLVSEA
jgi:peptide chain release factor 2